tara:strand:+ start:142 stop:468 length:327 start_codon:yes stop_codon:yes gene_type:complete
MASKVKGGASPDAFSLSLQEMKELNKFYPKDRRLSAAELKAIFEATKGLRKIKMNKGGTTMPMHGKKKSKMMSRGGAGTKKKTKYMSKGGAGMKKTKYMSRGGAARRK